MRSGRRVISEIMPLVFLAAFLVGCEDSSSNRPHDFGDNNPNLYMALGDSITGGAPDTTVTQYPAKLSVMLGKTVIDAGIGGEQSIEGAARARDLLARYRPGYLLVLYGANDVHDYDADFTITNLVSIINDAKANNTIPVLATITPAFGHYGFISVDAPELNEKIRRLAHDHDLLVADLEKAFGSNQDLFLSDNLHPNEDGTDLIAATFAAVLNKGQSVGY